MTDHHANRTNEMVQADASGVASSEKVIGAAAKAATHAIQIVDNNIVAGDVDDDTAVVTTGGMIGDVAVLIQALQSIASNVCCDKCREAALVARSALDHVGVNFSNESEGSADCLNQTSSGTPNDR